MEPKRLLLLFFFLTKEKRGGKKISRKATSCRCCSGEKGRGEKILFF